jgi:hypothetical protein
MEDIELNLDGTFPHQKQPLFYTTATASTTPYCEHKRWIADRIVIKRFGLEITKEPTVFCYDCDKFINGKEAERLINPV